MIYFNKGIGTDIMDKKNIFGEFNRFKISKNNKYVLKKLGIYDIQKLSAYSLADISSLLTINKLTEFQESFILLFNDIKFSTKYFRNPEGILCHDIKIEYLAISTRAYNTLIKMQIYYLSDILLLDDQLINSFDGIGIKTIDEILNIKKCLNSIIKDRIVEKFNYDDLSKATLHILKEIRLKEDIDGSILFDDIYLCLKEEDKLSSIQNTFLFENERIFSKLSKTEKIKTILFNNTLEYIKKYINGVSYYDLSKYLPRGFNYKSIIDDILDNLSQQQLIYLENDCYIFKYASILNYVNSIEKSFVKDILIARLQGKKLEEIGTEVNLSRERIRQIVFNIMKNRPVVFEDQYKHIFMEYHFEKDQFAIAFNLEDYVYNYLSICYTKGSKMMEECFYDASLSKKEIVGIEKALYENYFLIGDTYVKSQRRDICEYVIKTFGNDGITYEDFVALYYSLLEDLGIRNNENYSIEGRSYENKLVSSEYVLWKYGRKLRYYNIHAYDFNELLTSLDLNKYIDQEISTLLLFRSHQELMDTYDIKDEYELHNLLKKLLKDQDNNIKFHRMPNIEIGNGNREKQVFDLLTLYAPIDNVTLAKKYEEEYGVLFNTVLANHFKEISIYFHDGVYKLDNPIPSDEVLNKLKFALNCDFYMMKEAKNIIMNTCPKLDNKFINPYVFKSIGYKPYTKYILKDSFMSAAGYFRSLLTKNDQFNLKDISYDILNLGGFQSELMDLKQEYEIIEYLPSNYIHFRKLIEKGITKNDLNLYCDFIWDQIENEEYFTIHSLIKKGIKKKINGLEFDDLFYASILSECKPKFHFRRIGNNKVFIKGTKSVLFLDFLKYVFHQNEISSIGILNLVKHFEDEYNVVIEKYKLIEQIKGTTMFYDQIYDKIYLNSQIYYEENLA